jgi:outer membrane lipase/esterase
MRNLRRNLRAGAAALALAVSGSAFAQFSNMYFIGDSLTDAGIYGGARFTVNPGLVWAQDLGAIYGFTITPSNQGGTDYAQGGARVALPSADIVPGFAQRPASTQVDELLRATPRLDPNALYTVWIGANDGLQNFSAALAGQITLAQVQANLVVAMTQVAQQVARLSAAGARYIVVMNQYDGGKTPYGLGLPPGTPATALTTLINSSQSAALAQLGIQIIQPNVFALMGEIIAQPGVYGFTNVTQPACTSASVLGCTSATLVAPNAAQTYLYADSIHPTPAAHVIIAQYVASLLQAPQQMAVLAEAPLAVEQANWRTLDARMISGINAPRSAGKLEAWAAYDYGNPDFRGGFFTGGSNVNTLSVGGDMKIANHWLAGAQFGYSENKGDMGVAGYKLTEPMATLYVGYGDGPWYLGGTVGAGSLDISTTRNIALGAATRTESGDTRGWQAVARLVGGYWFQAGGWTHGPAVRLTYQDVRVNELDETGADSTTMSFGAQRRKSLVASAGWQASGEVAGFRPYARASWEYESKTDLRTVTASIYGMGGSFSLPAYKPDNSYALLTLGASKDFGGVTGFITGSGTAGKGDGNYYGVTAGLRVPL